MIVEYQHGTVYDVYIHEYIKSKEKNTTRAQFVVVFII